MKHLIKPKKRKFYLSNPWKVESSREIQLLARKRFFKSKKKKKFSSYFRIKSLNLKQNFTNLITKGGLKLKYTNIVSKSFQIFFFFLKETTHFFTTFLIFLNDLVLHQNILISFQSTFYWKLFLTFLHLVLLFNVINYPND